MLKMFTALFTAVATSANAANDVALAASYHAKAYEKTSLVAAAKKYSEAKQQLEVSEDDIKALLA